ncbi:MAG: c-type cytochrome [Desulfobacterales bacterium]|jgi:mono/diheme cytochrome c family protein|nr:c-type cytochrome [Desulfobacterales bacterium]
MKKLLAILLVVAAGGVAAFHLLTFYDNDFRYGRMRETPAVKPHEEPLPIMPAGVVPVSGGDALYRRTPAAQLASPVALDEAAVIARGKAVYFTFCAQCHGLEHNGEGTVGQSFKPLPTDLRGEMVQSKPTGELFHTVSYGIPGGRQPALETTVTVEDRWSVVAYVKSLGLRR